MTGRQLFVAIGAIDPAMVEAAEETKDLLKKAHHYKDAVLTKMSELRELTDEMELLVSRKHWPFPTYGDLLFSVR